VLVVTFLYIFNNSKGTNLLLDTFALVYECGLNRALISLLNMFALISSQLHFGPNIKLLFSTRNICWKPKRPKRNFCHLHFRLPINFRNLNFTDPLHSVQFCLRILYVC